MSDTEILDWLQKQKEVNMRVVNISVDGHFQMCVGDPFEVDSWLIYKDLRELVCQAAAILESEKC